MNECGTSAPVTSVDHSLPRLCKLLSRIGGDLQAIVRQRAYGITKGAHSTVTGFLPGPLLSTPSLRNSDNPAAFALSALTQQIAAGWFC